MRPLADQAARRRIAEDVDATLVVEAAAGTGKTTALVGRIVAMVASGRATLGGVVAVTFTEKAAGEMKLRLRAAVEHARATGADRERLDRALAELEVTRIGTIHSFCADLLRERPVEARVDPLFDVMAEDEARRLFDQAFRAWLESELGDPHEGVRRALRRRWRGEGGPTDALRDAAWRLVEHRDFTAPWRRQPFERTAEIDRVVAELRTLGAFVRVAEKPDDWLAKNLAEVDRFVAELDHFERVRERDHDGLEADLRMLARDRTWTYAGRRQRFGDASSDEVRAERDRIKTELDRLLERCDADLAARLHAELAPVVAAYEAMKARAGKLDFLDLLVRARDLVVRDATVRAELQQRFSHLFVDEFQDTDPLQAELLLLLAAGDPAETDWKRVRPVPGKLFIVGDPKQSIYRFRRADVAVYEAVKEQLRAGGGEVVYLTRSFRSAPSIQRAINAAFSAAMAPTQGSQQAAYVALEPYRADPAGQPTVVALPVPRPYWEKSGRVTKINVAESEPDAVAAFVAWLLRDSRWTVTERDADDRVPIAPRHVCLLLKRFQNFGNDVTRAYVRGLEARRISHVLVGGRSFHQREEILALRNALTAVEWPDDELSVFATLRGPFFALHDEALLAYRAASKGSLHPLRQPPGDEHSQLVRDVGAALAVLARLHRRRNRHPVADTIAQLLEATRAHAGIAIWPHGEQALANVLRLLDLARRFEARGATSFRAFVERLDEEAARGEVSDAPVVEEGTEGVRIMTVHRAKGLEFPIVILCDPGAPASRDQPTRHVDGELWAEPLAGCAPYELLENRGEALARDREESVRLAYVAATRARDLLVVPAVGDAPLDGWVEVLHPSLYPPVDSGHRPEPAPGCPPFGRDTVLERPANARYDERATVLPGLHVPHRGEHRVVWWDPSKLDLDRQIDVGLKQEKLLTVDEGARRSDAGVRAHEGWQARRAAVSTRGAAPSLRVETITRQSRAGTDAPDVALERTSAARERRPRGGRFGSLVHAVLAMAPLDADGAALAGAAAVCARLVGASAEEEAAATLAAQAAHEHPLLARARASAASRREVPVALRLETGDLVEGVIDLAFRDDAGWTVVDFKTDAEIEGEALGAYRRQVALYARAIAAATGLPATGVLLSV
jgi:ATP-dependent exoDNAse (exonuclease V) beta subunit